MNSNSSLKNHEIIFICIVVESVISLLLVEKFWQLEPPEVIFKTTINIGCLVVAYMCMIHEENIHGFQSWYLAIAGLVVTLSATFNVVTEPVILVPAFFVFLMVTTTLLVKHRHIEESASPLDQTFLEYARSVWPEIRAIEFEDAKCVKFNPGMKDILNQIARSAGEGNLSGVVEIYYVDGLRKADVSKVYSRYLDQMGEKPVAHSRASENNTNAHRLRAKGNFFARESADKSVTLYGMFCCSNTGVFFVYSEPVNYESSLLKIES